MMIYLNLRVQVILGITDNNYYHIMGMWDMLMITNCNVQVLKYYEESLIYVTTFLK